MMDSASPVNPSSLNLSSSLGELLNLIQFKMAQFEAITKIKPNAILVPDDQSEPIFRELARIFDTPTARDTRGIQFCGCHIIVTYNTPLMATRICESQLE